MSTAVENPEPTSAGGAKSKAASGQMNKYEEVRRAKKKKRRVAHVKTIRRSNTNG